MHARQCECFTSAFVRQQSLSTPAQTLKPTKPIIQSNMFCDNVVVSQTILLRTIEFHILLERYICATSEYIVESVTF